MSAKSKHISRKRSVKRNVFDLLRTKSVRQNRPTGRKRAILGRGKSQNKTTRTLCKDKSSMTFKRSKVVMVRDIKAGKTSKCKRIEKELNMLRH